MFFKTVLCFALTLFLFRQSYADDFSELMERYKNSTDRNEKSVLADQLKALAEHQLSEAKSYQKTKNFNLNIPARVKKGHIQFEDGRVCKNCMAYISPNGFITSVKDSTGIEWLTEQNQKIMIDTHPYLRKFATIMAQGKTVRTNCTSFGDSINCRSTHY